MFPGIFTLSPVTQDAQNILTPCILLQTYCSQNCDFNISLLSPSLQLSDWYLLFSYVSTRYTEALLLLFYVVIMHLYLPTYSPFDSLHLSCISYLLIQIYLELSVLRILLICSCLHYFSESFKVFSSFINYILAALGVI